jgi:hypothetical protein
VTPATTALLLGGSMALSALTLVVSSAGCRCFMNLCAEAYAPGDDVSCSSGEYYYSCGVELEGPYKAEYTQVTIAGCFAGADQAQEDAPAIAQDTYHTRYPGTLGRTAICNVADCPEAGTGGGS